MGFFLSMCSYTPLMEAAREGHEDVVQLLVEHGANVNTQTEETQETALTLACCGGFTEVVQYLIEHGQSIIHIIIIIKSPELLPLIMFFVRCIQDFIWE